MLFSLTSSHKPMQSPYGEAEGVEGGLDLELEGEGWGIRLAYLREEETECKTC